MKNKPKVRLIKRMKPYKYIYIMLFFVAGYYIIFKYIPMYGIQIAFKDFSMRDGILGSAFNGVDNFKYLFKEKEFWLAFKNTLIISFMKIIVGFPIPIIISLMLNELVFTRYKKTLQIIYTFPHFLSWVIISSMIFNILSSSGAVNNILALLGFEKVEFLTNTDTFRWLIVFSDIWKEAGWGTIIYMATITGVDPSLYEAAKIDGANRLQKIIYIIWPGIKSVAVTMLILNFGQIMSAGYMQILNMYNPSVYSVADILDTYVYRITFLTMPDYGVSTAVGLFTGVTNFIMLCVANFISKLLGEKGIF